METMGKSFVNTAYRRMNTETKAAKSDHSTQDGAYGAASIGSRGTDRLGTTMRKRSSHMPMLTMIAMQKSQIGFQAALQVRNKLVQAYTDIMSMQV